MSDTVYKINGDTLVVRTGTLSGIGPQGSTGPAGPRGLQGPQGAQGVPGPMGAIDDKLTSVTSQGSPFSIPANTDTVAPFATVTLDELKLATNSNTFTLPSGVWFFVCQMTFNKPSSAAGSGSRRIQVFYNGAVMYETTRIALTTDATTFQVVGLINARGTNAGKSFQVKVRQGDVYTITGHGKLEFTKIGPGAQGPAGPQGDIGPVGPQGPVGAAGPAGNISGSETTYRDLLNA